MHLGFRSLAVRHVSARSSPAMWLTVEGMCIWEPTKGQMHQTFGRRTARLNQRNHVQEHASGRGGAMRTFAGELPSSRLHGGLLAVLHVAVPHFRRTVCQNCPAAAVF